MEPDKGKFPREIFGPNLTQTILNNPYYEWDHTSNLAPGIMANNVVNPQLGKTLSIS